MTREVPAVHSSMHMGSRMLIDHHAPREHAGRGWLSITAREDPSSGMTLFPCEGDPLEAAAQLMSLAAHATALAEIIRRQHMATTLGLPEGEYDGVPDHTYPR